jgi:hypothetical protein
VSQNETLPAENNSATDVTLLQQQDNHQFEFAMAGLQAQERDREKEREHNRASQKIALKFFCGLGLVILIITITALCLDKEQFIRECIHYIAVGGGGWGAGYYFGYKRRSKEMQ